MNNPASQPLDAVIPCAGHHLHILKLAVEQLRRLAAVNSVHVITARRNFDRCGKLLGKDVVLLDEDTLIPTMTLKSLRPLNLPYFPKAAGWYYQQLLKFAFAFREETREHYLIWDADTVLLRPLEFFDDEGRMMFTISDEYHEPYFRNYRKLLGHEPHREFSFIAQHMIVNKAILLEMLARIEQRLDGADNWAWKIIRNLEGEGPNLFSEFELYGHYVKSFHPGKAVFRRLAWTRDGTRLASFHPRQPDLQRLAQEYWYASFELYHKPLRHAIRRLKARLG